MRGRCYCVSANTADDRRNDDLREFTLHNCFCFVLATLPPAFKRDEEAMVPCGVVANVVREEPIDERHFVSPQYILIEVCEQPLPVAPSVVVLRIDLEYLLVEG